MVAEVGQLVDDHVFYGRVGVGHQVQREAQTPLGRAAAEAGAGGCNPYAARVYAHFAGPAGDQGVGRRDCAIFFQFSVCSGVGSGWAARYFLSPGQVLFQPVWWAFTKREMASFEARRGREPAPRPAG